MADESSTPTEQTEAARKKEARRTYGASVVFVGIVPLLPIIIELAIRHEVTAESLIITASVYSIAVALASNSRFYFAFFLVASLIESAVYGSAVNENGKSSSVIGNVFGVKVSAGSRTVLSDIKFVLAAILVTFVSVLVERFSRHIRNREEFFEFLKGRGG